jgi:hypothetical protein
MTRTAGGQADRLIPVQHQLLAAADHTAIHRRRQWRRVRQVLRREILGQLPKEILLLSVSQVIHHWKEPPSVAEVHELIEKILRRLAGDTGVITVHCRTTVFSVTGSARQRSLSDRIERRLRRIVSRARSRRGSEEEDRYQSGAIHSSNVALSVASNQQLFGDRFIRVRPRK